DEYAPSREIIDEAVMLTPHKEHLRIFEGRLMIDSEAAYAQLDEALAPHDQFAVFRNTTDDQPNAPHEIHILTGRITPAEGRPWVNLALFIATLMSVLYVGALYGINGLPEAQALDLIYEITLGDEVVGVAPRLGALWRGLPYAISLMLILGAHELGHYFAARHHKHSVSLPYFIPLPIGLGTMGAVIRSREPMRNRKVLIDVGAAGPLAGMVFAIPILAIGLLTSDVQLISGEGLREGNSLLYAFMKIITLGQFYPTATEDVFINQMAFAGWLGLFVTALNLIPVGQLDGGHVVYSLFGIRARRLYYPVLIGMILLTITTAGGGTWFIWVLLLFFLGRVYAPPLDDITPLDPPRRYMAIGTLVLFVLVFVPVPFSVVGPPEGEPAPQNSVSVPAPVADALPFTLR
ncbi:MAG: site-2 protease family protein, partial [Chloroflexota bacterium]